MNLPHVALLFLASDLAWHLSPRTVNAIAGVLLDLGLNRQGLLRWVVYDSYLIGLWLVIGRMVWATQLEIPNNTRVDLPRVDDATPRRVTSKKTMTIGNGVILMLVIGAVGYVICSQYDLLSTVLGTALFAAFGFGFGYVGGYLIWMTGKVFNPSAWAD